MRITTSLIALVALTGCTAAPPVAENNVEAANAMAQDIPKISSKPAPGELPVRPLLNIAPGAIALVDPESGRSRELAFGTAKGEVIEAAARALDAAGESGLNRECGEGPMEYARFADGLSLWFQDEKFVGWFLGDAKVKVTTASGAGIGSTRSAVADAIAIRDLPGSTLGREFTTEGGTFSGLLEGTGDAARVSALWSGQACLMR